MSMRTRGLRGSGGNSGGNGRAAGSGDSQLTDTAGGVFIANLPGCWPLCWADDAHQAIPSVKVAVRAADRTDRHRVHGLARHTIAPPGGGTSTRVPGKGAGWAHTYLAESRRGRHSGKMPTSDWESVRQLRGDALWEGRRSGPSDMGDAEVRAGRRVGNAGRPDYQWRWIGGLPCCWPRAYPFCMRATRWCCVLRGGCPDRCDGFRAVVCLSRSAARELIGIAELLGLVSLGMATGWPLRLLAADPATAAVGSVITVGILGSVVANTAGHLVWEVDQDDTAPKWMRSVRLFIGPFGAAVGLALLWWASPTTPARFVAGWPADGDGRLLAVDSPGQNPGQGHG